MAINTPLVPTPPEPAQTCQTNGQQQRYTLRWRWYRCKPLVAIMWLAAGMVTVPMWVWIIK